MSDLLKQPQIIQNLDIPQALLVAVSALVLGLIISGVYIFTHKREGYSQSFVMTLLMITITIAMLLFLLGNNLAGAFSLLGAFSLIRFRSAPGNPKDIAYVFFSMSIGLACGIGCIGYAFIFCLFMSVIMLAAYFLRFPRDVSNMIVKITVAENVNYIGLFDDVLNRYTYSHRFKDVKTADFGTLFIVSYYITLKKDVNSKEFLDELRCLNDNLNIALSADVKEQ